MTILFIDTSKTNEIVVTLEVNGRKTELKSQSKRFKAQMVLPLIEKVLQKNKLDLTDLNEIKVKRGPGSFTGLRVGIAVANALGFALDIPVNGKKQPVIPLYE